MLKQNRGPFFSQLFLSKIPNSQLRLAVPLLRVRFNLRTPTSAYCLVPTFSEQASEDGEDEGEEGERVWKTKALT